MPLLPGLLLMSGVAAGDWLTFGGDPQRTGWVRESAFTKENAGRLKLEWKINIDNRPKELNSLTAPLVAGGVITPRGFMELVVVAGSSDVVFAVDADSGKLFWQRKLAAEGTPKSEPHWLCPNALNATPVIDRQTGTVYVIASDGKLHSLSLVNGEELAPAAQFVPPFSKNWSLNLADGVIYTTISQGCNGAKSAVYAMDVTKPERPVTSLLSTTTGGAGIWGRAGAAISPSGLVFAETGDGPYDAAAGKLPDTILAVSVKDLKLVDYYTPANRAWITRKDLDMGCISPVVFPFKQSELVAGSGKEGVIYLLDAKSPGGADHRTPLYRSGLITNEEANFWGRGFWGAFATREDDKGARWLYAPAWGPPGSGAPKFDYSYGETPNGSIMAFRVEEKDGKLTLAGVWMSSNLSVPEPPVVAGGVVFALSNGENVEQVDSQGKILTSAQRATRPAGNAVLYAFDADTGKDLYSSKDAISGWTHFSGLGVSGGRMYVVTHDSHLYAFGLGEE